MTEKEKAAAGMLYDANGDPTILAERNACKEICYDYNLTRPSQQQLRRELLTRMLGRIGEHVEILPPFNCDLGYNISIGDHFFANVNTVILDEAPVTFGDHVFIGPNCGFHTAGHPLDVAQRDAGLEYARPITIGSHVWIGAGVHVLPGVTIGDGAVIAAGAIVTHDIPPYTLAAGIPATPKKQLPESSVER